MKQPNIPRLLLLFGALLAVLTLAACGSVSAQPMQQSNTPTPELEAAAAPASDADTSEAASTPEALLDVLWAWQSFADQSEVNDITVNDPAQYTLTFGSDGTVAIKADCNNAAGTFTVDGSSLTIQIGPMTMAMCPEDSLSDQYIAMLGDVVSYVFNEDDLVLNLKADAGNMIFAAGEAEAEEAGGEEAAADETGFVGVYRTLLPAADSPGRLVTLTIAEDGAAGMVTDPLNGQPPIIEVGEWEETNEGALQVSLTERNGQAYLQPSVITFEMNGNRLTAIAYDATEYGSSGLNLRKQSETGRMSAASTAKRALIDLDLEAGFALDPFIVSVNGGGEIDVSDLIEDCNGFVNVNPVVSLDWQGDAEFVKAFFVSDHDPMMVVQTPNGEYLCSDDANSLLLDPVLKITDPPTGRYNIWVGSYAENQLIPGILVLTTRPDVDLGTFALGSLIRRPQVPEILPEPELRIDPTVVTEALARFKGDEIVMDETDNNTASADVASEGEIPAFDIPLEGPGELQCTGYISDTPDMVIDWTGDASKLAFFFEGDQDATLIVIGPDGRVLCNDDAVAGENLNPLILVDAPQNGRYGVVVGRLNTDEPLNGKITVTAVESVQPNKLAPAQ
ncbi:MAG: META domain-containing protein [Caldilineales bacterium]|nr:META domain-containing protein [Caldilineales bacterium]